MAAAFSVARSAHPVNRPVRRRRRVALFSETPAACRQGETASQVPLPTQITAAMVICAQ